MIETYRTVGAYATGEGGLAILPKGYPRTGSKRGVLLLHGGTNTEVTNYLTRPGNLATLAQAIADAGYPCFAPYSAGDSYCNDTAIARTADAKTYLQGALGAKAGKVAILGASMGGGQAYAYTRANPTAVSCLIGIEPLSDLNDVVVNNRAGVAAAVNAAYGGAYNNAVHGPTHNPESYKAQLAGVRTQIWYATDDPVVLPATVLSIATAIGSTAELHPILGGHNDTAIGQITANTVISYLDQYAA